MVLLQQLVLQQHLVLLQLVLLQQLVQQKDFAANVACGREGSTPGGDLSKRGGDFFQRTAAWSYYPQLAPAERGSQSKRAEGEKVGV